MRVVCVLEPLVLAWALAWFLPSPPSEWEGLRSLSPRPGEPIFIPLLPNILMNN